MKKYKNMISISKRYWVDITIVFSFVLGSINIPKGTKGNVNRLIGLIAYRNDP